MLNTMKQDFIIAYTWMYGSTKSEASRTYAKAMEIADYSYIKEIISCFKDNARRSFYDD